MSFSRFRLRAPFWALSWMAGPQDCFQDSLAVFSSGSESRLRESGQGSRPSSSSVERDYQLLWSRMCSGCVSRSHWLVRPAADRKRGPARDAVGPAGEEVAQRCQMLLFQGLPAARPRCWVQSPREPGAAAARGACRAHGLFLASSWGTTIPWLGVSDDCADWQVDRLEIWIRVECTVLSLKSIEQARQNGNLNKISRLQSLNSFFLFFMCNFTSVCWRGGRFSKEYTPAHKSTGRGNWEKRPSFSEVYNAEGHLQRDSERSKGEISALTVDPALKLLVRAGPRACTQSL